MSENVEKVKNVVGKGLGFVKKNIKALSLFMDVDSIKAKAKKEANETCGRSEVPTIDSVYERLIKEGLSHEEAYNRVERVLDLFDSHGKMLDTPNHYAVSSRVLPEDTLRLGPSPALLIIESFLMFIMTILLVGTVSNGFIKVNVGTAVLGFFVVTFFAKMFNVSTLVGKVWGALVSLLGVGFFLAIIVGAVMSGFLGGGMLGGAVGYLNPNYLLHPSFLEKVVYALCLYLCFAPYFQFKQFMQARIGMLLAQSRSDVGAEGITKGAEARLAQFENALKDPTPQIPYGNSLGKLSALNDSLAPDQGLPIIGTLNDAKTHVLVLGETGTGKTSGTLRPIGKAYVDAKYGGLAVFDGKGALPNDFINISAEYVMISPRNAVVNVLENMSVSDRVAAILDASPSGDSENQYFKTQGTNWLTASSYLHLAHVKIGLAKDCYSEWDRFSNILNNTTDNGNPNNELAGCLNQITDPKWNHILHLDGSAITIEDKQFATMLQGQINYCSNLFALDDKTRSNIHSTAQGLLSPVMLHPELRVWAESDVSYRILPNGTTQPFDTEMALKGGMVGYNIPESTYKDAGKICSILLKQKLLAGIKLRGTYGDNWRDYAKQKNHKLFGHKDIMIMIDEFHILLNKTSQDIELASILRSLGGMFVFASQSMEFLNFKFGEQLIRGFFNNFKTIICYKASAGTMKYMTEERFEKTVAYVSQTPQSCVDYEATSKLVRRLAIFDTDHPDHKEVRKFIRGSGGIQLKLYNKDQRDSRGTGLDLRGETLIASATGGKFNDNHAEHKSYSGGFFNKMTSAFKRVIYKNALHLPIISERKRIERPLVTMEEAQTQLLTPFTALVSVQRGGVVRRDFVKVTPLDANFKEFGK